MDVTNSNFYRFFPSDGRARTQLCDVCKWMSLNRLLGSIHDENHPSWVEHEPGWTTYWEFERIQRSAENCPFCHSIVFAIHLSGRTPKASNALHLRPTRGAGDVESLKPSQTIDGFIILEVDKYEPYRWRAYNTSRKEFEQASLGFLKCIIPPEGFSANLQAPSKTRTKILRLDASTRFQAWTTNCAARHASCRDSTENAALTKINTRPSRLLKITDVGTNDFRLNLTNSYTDVGNYVALSYCWGANTILKTTPANIKDHEENIPISDLPQTYIDAIRITRSIGLHLIWIDALCIIQDEPDLADWTKESCKMNSIFAGADLTISAAASDAASGGCFPTRPARTDWAALPVTAKRLHDARSNVAYFLPLPAWSVQWTFDKDPLQQRGWTFQEQALSRRILYCSSYEYVFVCRSDWQSCFDTALDLRETALISKKGMLLPYSYLSAAHAGAAWALCLKGYFSRNLTFEDDKLIAIQGLVNLFAIHIPSLYLFGIWEQFLPWGLLWTVIESPDEDTEPVRSKADVMARRRVEGRAPSWSWASIDSRCELVTGFPDESLATPESDSQFVEQIASPSEHFQVKAAFVTDQPGTLEFASDLSKRTRALLPGRISKLLGHKDMPLPGRGPTFPLLKLTGALFKAVLCKDEPGFRPSKFSYTNLPGWHLAETDGSLWHPTARIYIDDPLLPASVPSGSLDCYIMPFTPSRDMLLMATETRGRYRRIGLCHHPGLLLGTPRHRTIFVC